ncbi:MAG: hypothetical protein KBS82_05435 [Oscillospiraceae bacterium]|nr:hypothetical protein [Candidatus Limimonas egerieequi]
MKYEVNIWKKGEFIGSTFYFETATEAIYFLNRSGAIKGEVVDGATGIIVASFGFEND